MVTATDAESSTWRRASQSIGAHVAVLVAMIERMKSERDRLPVNALADRILADTRIRNVERDLRAVQTRLIGR